MANVQLSITDLTIDDFIQFEGDIKASALHMGARSCDVDDIVQDVYMKLLKIQAAEGNLNRLEWNGKPNKGYLYLITRSVTTETFRAGKRRKRDEDAFLHASTLIEGDEYNDVKENELKVVEEALDELHFFPREVFKAYAMDDHTMRSLSKATGIGLTTIRQEINYVREQIKRKRADSLSAG